MQQPDLSIIIVHYNVPSLLQACLNSIARYLKNLQVEVIVLDNASPDCRWRQLIKTFPEVRFEALPQNLGFAKANNLGVKMARAENILLLNPDTAFVDESFYEAFNFFQQKENIGCMGVRLFNAHGDFLPESKRNIPNLSDGFVKLFLPSKQKKDGYYRNDLAKDSVAPVAVITGAFLVCKKERYLEIGGLDEAYFMYGEDIDLCMCFLKAGYENWYFGRCSVLHYKGESTIKDQRYLDNFYGAMEIFAKKYYRHQPVKLWAIRAGLKVKKRRAEWALKHRT